MGDKLVFSKGNFSVFMDAQGNLIYMFNEEYSFTIDELLSLIDALRKMGVLSSMP